MTFAESSPKSGYAIFFVNIMKCQQNCICCGCRYVFFLYNGYMKGDCEGQLLLFVGEIIEDLWRPIIEGGQREAGEA